MELFKSTLALHLPTEALANVRHQYRQASDYFYFKTQLGLGVSTISRYLKAYLWYRICIMVAHDSTPVMHNFSPALGLLSIRSFKSSPRVCMGCCQVLQFPPKTILTGYSKQATDDLGWTCDTSRVYSWPVKSIYWRRTNERCPSWYPDAGIIRLYLTFSAKLFKIQMFENHLVLSQKQNVNM